MWEAKDKTPFEMPMGGTAIMRKGKNMLKLSRKEQCLALTAQLRSNFKISPCFWRVYPNGEVQYLHPKDGVFPEKSKKRDLIGVKDRGIMAAEKGPLELKFTDKEVYDV